VCTNALFVRRDELEESLLRGLAESVLRTEAIDYIIAKMEDSLREHYQKLDSDLERLRQRRQQLEGEIGRLVQAIAEGQSSKSLMATITERETELKVITDKLLEPGPGSLRETLENLKTIALKRLAALRELISHPESIDQARVVLAEHFGSFKLEAVEEKGEWSYRARGKVDFFGDSALARTGGAEGQNRTGYARLFRAALYQ
jgi:hypothetical protein